MLQRYIEIGNNLTIANMNIAAQRIQREFKEVFADEAMRSQFYIEADESNILSLKGYVNGPPDTPYEGGNFHLEMTIPDTYPFSPPKVKFVTRIWHPNISSATGAICLDILKDQWAAAMTIRTVMLSLQTLLAIPEANDPQDAVVARQYIDNYELFKHTARYWTYRFAIPGTTQIHTRLKLAPPLAKTVTMGANYPVAKFVEFNAKVKKLVEIMQTDELTAIHELSSHNWDLDRATQSLISS